MRDVRQNKGSILKASVDYIRILKKEKERKIHIEEKCKKTEQINRKLLIKLQVHNRNLILFNTRDIGPPLAQRLCLS